MISYFRNVSAGLARASHRREPIGRLSYTRPYFLAEYYTSSIHGGMHHIFLSDEDQLLEFVEECALQGNIVERVRVMTPGYMNGSGFLQLDDLLAVWAAEEPHMHESALVYTLSNGVELVKSTSFTKIEQLGKRKLLYRSSDASLA